MLNNKMKMKKKSNACKFSDKTNRCLNLHQLLIEIFELMCRVVQSWVKITQDKCEI